MGFSLTIEEGKDLGRQFTFDQPEVSIGRTAENDVVLQDPGVSRRHAVIRDEGGRFFVQDLGSANGTQVNGNPAADEEVQNGDEIAVGPVIFRFEAMAADDGSTRILDASALMSPPKPARGSPEDLAEVRRKTTALPVRRPQKSLARPAAAKPERPAPSSRKRPAPIAKAAKGPSALSASERSRMLRENKGPVGKIKLFLAEKPPAVRNGIFGGAGLLGLVLVALIVKAVMPGGGPVNFGPGPDRSKDKFSLGEPQEENVFGYGEHLGVTIQTQTELHFEFEHSDTIPIVYYIAFESQGIERQEEVDISLNGVLVGNVAPALGDYAKEQRFKLPRKHLKTGVPNEIVFDNTFNPPGQEPWAISKVRLKMVPLPGCNPDGECEREAKKHYDLAEVLWAQKGIHSANAYNAWTNLHKAQLFLEAVEPKPALGNLVQAMLRDVERYLDNVCAKTFLEAKKFEELGDWDRALKEYKSGLQWFPGEDHSCRARLQDKIFEYG